jgi:hypothetical protein
MLEKVRVTAGDAEFVNPRSRRDVSRQQVHGIPLPIHVNTN